MVGGGIIRAPYSNITLASSCSGKTWHWKHLIAHAESVFDPVPSHYYIFSHTNLAQYDDLVELLGGAENVTVAPVQTLPSVTTFRRGALVLLDELNSALVGLTGRARKLLVESVFKIYNLSTHHQGLYCIALFQQLCTTDFSSLLGLTQSMALSAANAKSGEMLRRAGLPRERCALAIQLFEALRDNGRTQFVHVYPNGSPKFPFVNRFMFAGLENWPHFALAFGSADTTDTGDPNFEVVSPSAAFKLSIADAEAHGVLVKMSAKLPDNLKRGAFALVPMASVSFALAAAAGKQAASSRNEDDDDEAAFEQVNRQVRETLKAVCKDKELVPFSSFWHFIQRCPFLCVDKTGMVLYKDGHAVNLLTFMRECLKKQPPPPPGIAGGKKRKPSKKAADDRLQPCVPFAAALLSDASFPPHLLQNNPRLVELATRYNESRAR